MQPHEVKFTTNPTRWETFMADLSELTKLSAKRGRLLALLRDDVLKRSTALLEPVVTIDTDSDWPNMVIRLDPSPDAERWFMRQMRAALCPHSGLRLPCMTYFEWSESGRPWNAVPTG